MNGDSQRAYTRRIFLNRGITLASAAVTVPWFVQRSALAMANPAGAGTSIAGVPQDRVLVVIQLAGGNDGLNTVVPFGDAAYYKARPGINIPADKVLKFDKKLEVGLHPSMTGFKDLWDQGQLAIVQGVGYPNPNRSHFKSMDIWHTADTSGVGEGWLGRYFDNQCNGEPTDGAHANCSGHAGIAIGRSAPLAMEGRSFKPVSFESEELFRWTGLDIDPAMEDAYNKINRGTPDAPSSPAGGGNAEFLTRTAMDAQIASDKIRAAVRQQPLVGYPGSPLAKQLAMVAQMIRANLETRVYYVSLGGFDTHAGQGSINGSQANLLRQLADGVKAFYADLKAQGNDTRVMTMSFSEFGRRVGQNGSNGTDHGTAAPMFLMGPMVKPGVHGRMPSLTDLDNGDLKFGTDFRGVYTGVLDEWMSTDAQKVLGKRYQAVKVVETS